MGSQTATDPVAEAEPRIERNDDEGRYEIWLGEVLGGFTQFRHDTHNRLVFHHTETDPAFAGRGLGKILVRAAMNDVARRGERIVPRCKFVARYLHKHDVSGLEVDWPDAPDFQP